MFDRIDQKPARNRTPMIALSLAVHGAAILAIVLISFWKIDKVSPAHHDLVMLNPGLVVESPPPSGAPRPSTPQVKTISRAQPHEAVQPQVQRSVEPAAPSEPSQRPGLDGNGTDPTVVGDPTLPACANPPCAPACDDPPCSGEPARPAEVKVPPPVATVSIAQDMIEGQRTAGSADVDLPPALVGRLASNGLTQVATKVRVCIGKDGATTAELKRSSGQDEVDRLVLAGVRAWRFRPYAVNGDPVEACFPVVFRYDIER